MSKPGTTHDQEDSLADQLDQLQPLLAELADDLEEARALAGQLENVERVLDDSQREEIDDG